MISKKPLPCPLCHSQCQVRYKIFSDGFDYWAECADPRCPATGPRAETRTDAVDAWNEMIAKTDARGD